MIGLELALIALIAAIEPTLRGMSCRHVAVIGRNGMVDGPQSGADPGTGLRGLAWQIRAHILIALLSYGLLTVAQLWRCTHWSRSAASYGPHYRGQSAVRAAGDHGKTANRGHRRGLCRA